MKADTSKPPVISTSNAGRISRVILASESPRRLGLLRSLGLDVDVVRSGYAEAPAPQLTPEQLARRHAHGKLGAVLRTRGAPRFPVLAADTVVDLDGHALGKPASAAEATRMLEALSGREHLVHTAFALAVPHVEPWAEECSTTRVQFFTLSPDEIDEYVSSGEPLDKAGAYGIQARAAAFIESIDGDFYTVMGLPLARFIRTLKRLGFALPDSK
jgi:septum formation protein